jgi:hypothetical protein
MTITLRWKSYKWKPTVIPDRAEYDHLRTLNEPQMKTHLKTQLNRVRAELTSTSPYSYRKSIIALTVAGVLLIPRLFIEADVREDSALYSIMTFAGWLILFGAVMLGASASMTYDSIRKNLIVAREHYVKCWVAAQKLEYPAFQQYMTKLINRPSPNYDVL